MLSLSAAKPLTSLFGTRNNVTYSPATGVLLQGWTTNPAYLAPSAGLLSLSAYDGDLAINVTIADYQLAQ